MRQKKLLGEIGASILIIEDSPTQAEDLQYLLEQNGYKAQTVPDGQRALDVLAKDLPDLIISDIIMPEMDGYQVCKHIKLGERTKQIPVILLTSLSGSEDVLQGLECGADYFITKPFDDKYLLTSVERILLSRRERRPDTVRIGTEIWVGGKSRLITTDQQQTLSLLISTYEAAVRANTELLLAQHELRDLNTSLEALVKKRTEALSEEVKEHKQSKERVQHLNLILRALRKVNGLIASEKDPHKLAAGICRIAVEHRGYDSAVILLEGEQRGLRVFNCAVDRDKEDQRLGEEHHELPPCCQVVVEDNKTVYLAEREESCLECPLADLCVRNDIMCARLDYGDRRFGYLIVTMERRLAVDPENKELFVGMSQDVASALYNIEQGKAREKAEQEKKRIGEELRQAQKMEAVGRLAGGVAHDYNNMLGVIIGCAELALTRVQEYDPIYKDLQEILTASRRSADLTKQLLAFSSRQIVAPKVVNLNREIDEQQNMLSRLIGEDIDFRFVPADDLWSLLIDTTQLTQIMANLAVNARDAIPDTGIITIETANVVLDKDYCRGFPSASPGEYVLLSFSDTGVGMDADLLTHIFEPFFTTKGEGKGSGLGLSTVFGIVKQHGGFIHTYSEPQLGTTFKIYLPRYIGESPVAEKSKPVLPTPGNETVLVVEDEKQLLALAKMVLERYGYKVLPANGPKEAIQLANDYQEKIDLLLSDVVMPDMNGKDLQAQIAGIKPGIKTLFMSGYTANSIVHRGVLDDDTAFISKPFALKDLASKVREVLDS